MGFFKEVEQVVAKVATLDERLAIQQSASNVAIDLFQRAAHNLEVAADELDKIAAESQAKAEAHANRAEDAYAAGERNRARATKIRTFLD